MCRQILPNGNLSTLLLGKNLCIKNEIWEELR